MQRKWNVAYVWHAADDHWLLRNSNVEISEKRFAFQEAEASTVLYFSSLLYSETCIKIRTHRAQDTHMVRHFFRPKTASSSLLLSLPSSPPPPPPPLTMALPFSSLFSLFLLLVFSLAEICNTSPITAQNGTVESLMLRLLHIKPFASPSGALSFDSRRLSTLFSTLHHPQSLKSPVVSGASTGSGQYFVDLRLGTPPQKLLLVADTGSDLVWVKCSACRNCRRHEPGSAFLARHSTTFSSRHCYDSACQLVPHSKHHHCNHTRLHSPCRYEYSYADGSVTSGFFSKETTTLNTSSGREVKVRGVAFGCAFRISGPSVTGKSFNGAYGVMGLGRGPISLSSQLGRRFGNKFSYCLMDHNISPPPTSYLLIGGTRNEIAPGNSRLRFTPLHTNPLAPIFYYIEIKSVSVDGAKLPINPSVWALDELGNGGTVVDSGTTLTFLAEPAYRRILTAMRRRVRLPSPAEPTPGFDLCVNVSGIEHPRLPKLSFKLGGDSVFSPPPGNYFLDTADDVKCLALQPVTTPSGFSVIGNLMQQGFLLEFDNDRSRLGFSRHGCALPWVQQRSGDSPSLWNPLSKLFFFAKFNNYYILITPKYN